MSISKQQASTAAVSVNTEALAAVAHQTRNLLAFHVQSGISHYPASANLLKSTAKKSAPLMQPVPQQISDKAVPGQNVAPPPRVSIDSSVKQLKVITRNISDCTSCALAPGISVPGQGSPKPSLFVIGDWYTSPDDPQGKVWGAKEDDLFWKMMAAIGLDRESVYVTNCIKCRPTANKAPDADRIRQCFTYLEQELMAIQPEFICTMGEVAINLLLKSSAPLVRMRGRFHQYRYPHGSSARVMPTFHPRFLLQHPEMKRATWMDLQAVQRVLQQKNP